MRAVISSTPVKPYKIQQIKEGKMKIPDNKTLLIVISLLFLGIFGFLAIDNSRHKTLGETIDEAAEEIEDEIDDHTTSK